MLYYLKHKRQDLTSDRLSGVPTITLCHNWDLNLSLRGIIHYIVPLTRDKKHAEGDTVTGGWRGVGWGDREGRHWGGGRGGSHTLSSESSSCCTAGPHSLARWCLLVCTCSNWAWLLRFKTCMERLTSQVRSATANG